MRNGSGTYSAPSGSFNPATNGNSATAADWDTLLADLVAAMTQSVSADGQTPITGNFNMGNNKLTSLGAGSASGQSLAWQQLFSQGTESDLASAGTTDIGAQNTNFLRITGTTTITSFGTNYNGPRFLRFAGALTLTHNATTLILPTGANITTAAGDTAIAIPISGGWYVAAYQLANGQPVALTDFLNTTRIDVASATTTDLTANAPNTRHINITGTTAITGFTVAAGLAFFVRFNAALTLTNNASIITQTGANITTAAGDTCLLRATASNTVEVLFYTKYSKTVVMFDALTKRNNTSTLVVPNNTITTYTVAASTFTEATDSTGSFNPTTGVFTAQRSGLYRFTLTGQCHHNPSVSSSEITAYGEIGGALQGAIAGSFSGYLEWASIATRGNLALSKFNSTTYTVNLVYGDTVTFSSIAPTFFNSVGVSVTYSPTLYAELAQKYTVVIEEL